MLLWGKTSQENGTIRYHPLLCHMLDVAAVARLVWDDHLTPGFRQRLERTLGSTNARALFVFAAGAHDIGKASPSFQYKVLELGQNSGLPPSNNDQIHPHGHISAHVLNQALGSCSASAVLARIAGEHHGVLRGKIG